MPNDNMPKPSARGLRSPGLKFFIIAALTVAMAVPLLFIQLALSDREQTASGAIQDVASGWGGAQIVAGPMVLVPYTVERDSIVDGKTVRSTFRYTAVLLPDNLNMTVRASEETRWRGIFAVPVYRATVNLHAVFDHAALAALAPSDARVLWNETTVSIMVSDAHGLTENVVLTRNGQPIVFEPGAGMNDQRVTGIQAPLHLAAAQDLVLDTDLALRGSRELSLSPLGRRTTARIQSAWPSPSFFGAFLPSERKVGADGFVATWSIPYLARGFGQSFATTEEAVPQLQAPAFGVRFYQPVDHYQLVQRSLKYAILFVALAFLVFFVVETVSPRRLHVVHYALVGAAQVLFYLLLLSLSEHIGFARAYILAATATIGLTSLYAISALASKARAGGLFVVLSMLYGLLYIILNAEDYALLIGSTLLFVSLAATMYVTRKIDWYRAADSQTV